MSPVELAAAAARAAVEDCGAADIDVAAAIDTVAGVRQFEISGDRQRSLGAVQQLPAIRGQPDRRRPRPRDPRGRRRPGASAPDHRVRRGDRGRSVTGRDGVRFGHDVDTALLRAGRGEAGLHRDCRRRTARPRSGHREAHLALHRQSRLDQRADPVRAAGERPPSRNWAGSGGVPAPDGRAVRAVHEDRREQPVCRGSGGTHRRRADHLVRAQPDDRRPVPPADGGARPGEPGSGRAADVRRGGAAARRPRRQLGLPARARRSGGAVAAGACRSRARAVAPPGGARGTGRGRHRSGRRRHLRPVQLLPGAGVQHLRRHGNRTRRSARPDPDRWAAVLRRRRATTTRCTPSPRPWPGCEARRGNSASSAPTAAS